MTRLEKLLAKLGPRKIVVVADRYPPSNFGGAEVSLHVFLSSLVHPEEVLVAAFEEDLREPRAYQIDGVDVVALPWQAAWPYVHRSRRQHILREGTLRLLGGKTAAWMKKKAIRKAEVIPPEDREMLVKALEAKPRGGVVCDFAEYADGLAIALLRQIFEATGAKLVHADNYRSIAWSTQASSGLELRRVGTVRDNRFHCARYSQSVRTMAGPCQGCDFSCAAEDLKKDQGLQKSLLERSLAFRLASLQGLDRVVVTSHYLEEKVGEFVDEQLVTRIANAVDRIEEAESTMRGVAELVGTNLLVVGMINENKGQLDFVRQLKDLAEELPDVKLHIVGRGERLQKRIEEISEDEGVGDRVVFRGFLDRDRIYQAYRECQIIICPTIWPEPFGRVPLEAGLTRRPVVSFAVGGLSESIIEGETGFLIEPGDWEGFNEAIERLASDPKLRFEMGQAAFEHVTRTYEAQKLSDKLWALWEEVLRG